MTEGRAFLLTGATLALGRAVRRALADHGRVIAVRAPHEPAPRADEGAVEVLELTRSEDLRVLLLGRAAEHGADTLVHLGSRAPGARTSLADATRLLLDIADRSPHIAALVLPSSAAVYRTDGADAVIVNEQHALDFAPDAPAHARAALEAEVAALQRIPSARIAIAVLRLSELLDPEVDGRLAEYLRPLVCLRPLGFDPMLNALSLEDAARACALAAVRRPRGVFNVPGADTLPLSEIVHQSGRIGLPVFDRAIETLYALRRFSRVEPAARVAYAALRSRFHFGAIPDGRAAREAFGYTPEHPIAFERWKRGAA